MGFIEGEVVLTNDLADEQVLFWMQPTLVTL